MQAWGPLVILSKLQHQFYSKITKEFLVLRDRGPLVFELKVTLVRYTTAISVPGGNFNRRVTGVCHLSSEIAP